LDFGLNGIFKVFADSFNFCVFDFVAWCGDFSAQSVVAIA
jgi:hypothetical protein